MAEEKKGEEREEKRWFMEMETGGIVTMRGRAMSSKGSGGEPEEE